MLEKKYIFIKYNELLRHVGNKGLFLSQLLVCRLLSKSPSGADGYYLCEFAVKLNHKKIKGY